MEIENVIEAVLNLTRVFNRTSEKNKGGLTLRTQILLALKKHNNEITVKQIFEHIKIAKTNLAILCNNLVKEGVIKKVKDEVDMRLIKYKLLEKGEKEINDFLSASTNCFKKILSEKELMELDLCSQKINDILN